MTQGNVEPVAWRWKYKKDTRWNYSPNEQTDNDPAVFEQQPLYAAALAPQVDEAMVERARVAFLESASDYTRLDVSIRACLMAAIGGSHP